MTGDTTLQATLSPSDRVGSRSRALFVNNLYAPNVGGVENSLRSMAKELKSRGVDVDIVCSDLEQSSSVPLPGREQCASATIYRYRYASGPLAPFQNIVRARRLLKARLREGSEYSIVVARSQGAVIALWLAGLRNTAYVVPAISAYQNSRRNDIRRPRHWLSFHVNSILQRVALATAARVVVLSRNMQLQVERFAGPKVKSQVVHPGVDTERFHPVGQEARWRLRRDLSLPEDKTLLLCLGRFSPVKGFHYAVRALAELPEDFVLVIVGEGPCEETYAQEARNLGVENRIIFRPRTNQPERYYQAMDIFVFTSTHEPFGQVLLEATSCGLPVAGFERSPAVATATHEIYEGTSSLVHWAKIEGAPPLSAAILAATEIRRYRSIAFEEEHRAFTHRYSWKVMVDVLSNSALVAGKGGAVR